jgi:hypothetical protein
MILLESSALPTSSTPHLLYKALPEDEIRKRLTLISSERKKRRESGRTLFASTLALEQVNVAKELATDAKKWNSTSKTIREEKKVSYDDICPSQPSKQSLFVKVLPCYSMSAILIPIVCFFSFLS